MRLMAAGLTPHSDETAARDTPVDAHGPSGNELNAAIARAVVGIYRDCVGRGPTRAEAFFRHNVVVVLLHGVMTTAERAVAASESNGAALDFRHRLHELMRPQLVASLESLTASQVIALMNDYHLKDLAVEVFVLDRPLQPQQTTSSSTPERL